MRKILYSFIACFLLTAVAVWGQGNAGGFASDALSSLDKAVNKPAPQITPEEDYYLGRAVAANIMSQPNYQPYTANPQLTAYLNRICQTLVINFPISSVYNGYHVVILNSTEYNAFATPGGHIMITKGLVEAASSEDTLAALIAHELAHIHLRHAAEIIDEMAFNDEMDAIAERAGTLSANTRAAQGALALRRSISPIVDTMMKNGFSQPQEFAADAKALELLDAAGYDPRAILVMLQKLQQVQSGRRDGFNSTHPSPRDRIANITAILNRYKPNNTQSYRQQRFINK